MIQYVVFGQKNLQKSEEGTKQPPKRDFLGEFRSETAAREAVANALGQGYDEAGAFKRVYGLRK